MKLTVLGCGTSTGVPVIGCDCPVCSSADPKNRRTRSSALVQTGGRFILIDTSTDLRAQALSHGIRRLDAVLFTHPHADHIHGIDDLRAFNLYSHGPIPCYGSAHTIERIKVMFDYVFSEDANESWTPNLTATAVDGKFKAAGVEVTPVEIAHGSLAINGFRLGNMAYLTDCSGIPEGSMRLLKGLDVLVLGALRHEPHPTHFTIKEAVEASRAVGAKRTVLTHLSHTIDYERDGGALPDGVELAYDGMAIEA